MALVEQTLPLYSDPSYTYEVELSGSYYNLEFMWNDRSSTWCLNINNYDESPIVTGIRLIPMINLLSTYKNPALPDGKLAFFNVSDQGAYPDQFNIETDFMMVYEYDDGQ